MIKNLQKNDLVVTDNFTLKQDIYRVQDDLSLKLIGRYEKNKVFAELTNIIKSEKLSQKSIKIYMKKNTFIPKKTFSFANMVEFY